MVLQKLNHFTTKVSDFADRPNATMTAEEVKFQFDAAPEEVRVYLNQLIDALQSVTDGDSGADQIGVTPIGESPDKLQGMLEWLKDQINASALGAIPDGTITTAKLSSSVTSHWAESTKGAHKAKNIAIEDINGLITATDVEGALKEVVSKANSAFTSANDGKTAVANAITAKGVSSSPNDTFSALAANIGQISTGKKFASGNFTVSNNATVAVSGLDFTPSRIIFTSRGRVAYSESSLWFELSRTKDMYSETGIANSAYGFFQHWNAVDGGGHALINSNYLTNDGFSYIMPGGAGYDFNGTLYWHAYE